MKKLYRKGTVHPSPPPPRIMSDECLSFLPAAILTLAAALSQEDRELLAYLLLSSSARPKRPSPSSSSAAKGGGASGDHAPQFGCDCFRCYTSYWVRWGSSPNRQLIHEIIEAFEDDIARRDQFSGQAKGGGARSGRKERRNNKQRSGGGGVGGDSLNGSSGELKRSELVASSARDESSSSTESEPVQGDGRGEEASAERGSQVRRLVSFIGERIWGVWG